MDATLLCNLKGVRRSDLALRLRLLHMWPTKTPTDPRIYNFCTLWVDETGTLIQGLSDATMGSGIQHLLRVGKIYVIKKFDLNQPPQYYRACSFDLALGLSSSATFQECGLPAAGFPTDSYEFFPFRQVYSRSGDNRILTDVIGRLHLISPIDHKLTSHGHGVKQTVVLEDDRNEKVTITLWDEFTKILDYVALTQADAIEPVVLDLVAFWLTKSTVYNYVLSSSAATRVAVNPEVPLAYHLASHFMNSTEVVASLPVQFATAAEAVADGDRRTKTIAELVGLTRTKASVEEKHCCGGVVVDVESRVPWYYTACKLCTKAVTPWRQKFWCNEDWGLEENQTKISYKIQLLLRDETAEARFIFLGSSGTALVNAPAAYLAQRFPHQPGQLPPQLEELRGQYVKFECKLPLPGPSGLSLGEFRVVQLVSLGDGVQGDASHVLPNPGHLISGPTYPSRNLSASPGVNSSTNLQCGASSSSADKGKAKVSGPLLYTSARPEFHIDSQEISLLSQTADSVMAAVGATASRELAPLAHDFVLSKTISPAKVADQDMLPQVQQQVSGPSVANTAQESVEPLAFKAPFTIQDSTLLDSVEDVIASSAKIPKSDSKSSPRKIIAASHSPQSSSPSASLLVSPLAKIKVEKLDASDIRNLGGASQASPASEIGEEPKHSGAAKEEPSKRRLFKK